jgi:NAD(P)-dependent dehydrogenase (short-subunit alcohol dehydrogenase family)
MRPSMQLNNFNNRVAIITGAGSGIGSAAAQRFGRQYSLLLCDVNAGHLEETLSAVRQQGVNAHAVVCDVAQKVSVEAMARAARDLGDVSAVFHCAGISPSMADAKTLFAVNFGGTANVIDALYPQLAAGAVAVCVASMSGHRRGLAAFADLLSSPQAPYDLEALVQAARGQSRAAYALSKRGVMTLVEQRASLWARKGARIVSISPGVVDTPMGQRETGASGGGSAPLVLKNTPLARFATADEVAALAQFLCQPTAGFITGCDILIDGGAIAGFHHEATPEARQAWDHPWA